MSLDELIEALTLLRKTPEDGAMPIHLEPDAWAIRDHVEIDDIARQDGRFMIIWGH
jgi:hypothetical protein